MEYVYIWLFHYDNGDCRIGTIQPGGFPGKLHSLHHDVCIVLLRREFKIKNLLQVPVGVLFGMFTTLCNHFVAVFPEVNNIGIRILMMLLSAVLIAVGIFLYVPVNFIPLAGEGAMLAIVQKYYVKFSNVKLCFDIGMVSISIATCLILLHKLGSVGIGTIIAAVLVGTVLKCVTKLFGGTRDKILGAYA